MTARTSRRGWVGQDAWGAAWCCLLLVLAGAQELPPSGPARWEPDIRAFEEQDAREAPARGGVVFVGSSSIRLWKLEESFPKLQALNRGFGGSHLADSVHFAERIVLKYEPRIVVIYAGDNDIASGKTAQQVGDDFRAFVRTVHARLPQTRILFIAIKPSIKRWQLVDVIRAANAQVERTCAADERLEFIDVFQPMLDGDGRPRKELFADDGLHLNERGYALWTTLLEPHLRSEKPR